MPDRQLRGLVVDWGGVLTSGIGVSMAAWARSDGIAFEDVQEVLRAWLGREAGDEVRFNPVHALERGELQVPHFEERLADELSRRSGRPVSAQGMLTRLFEQLTAAPDMVGLVRRAHASGLRTALLSNSWGNDYPRDGWAEMFDVVVISGEVGMRKPDAEIFHHTLDLLGLAADECVFVDDLPPNVRAAVEVGFVGVLHTSYESTEAELTALFQRQL